MDAQTAEYLTSPKPFIAPMADTGLDRDLTDFISKHQPTHFVKAHLFWAKARGEMDDALNDWVIRVNRCFLGRRWHLPTFEAKVMKVFAIVAVGTDRDDYYAVMLVRPPSTADLQDFPTIAAQHFANDHLTHFPPLGNMEIDPVEGLAVVHDTLTMVVGLETRPSTTQIVSVFKKVLASL